MSEPSLWCPACGTEYAIGSRSCSQCRVELVGEPPLADDDGTDLVEVGEFPRLQAQILRRRIESTGRSVMVEWSTGDDGATIGTILVAEADAEFTAAVINEIDVDDEVPDTSAEGYLARIEEHLAAVGALLDELRTRVGQAPPDPG